LLQQPGELVSREELQQQLWGDGTSVDFDHGLNVVVGRLRQALGDTAEQPGYIETLPRKGYRFMSSVEPVEVRPPTIDASHRQGLTAQQSRPVFRYPVRTFLIAAVAGLTGAFFWVVQRAHEASFLTAMPLTSYVGTSTARLFRLTATALPSAGRAIGRTTLISTSRTLESKHLRG
jgi:hypothetical protein